MTFHRDQFVICAHEAAATHLQRRQYINTLNSFYESYSVTAATLFPQSTIKVSSLPKNKHSFSLHRWHIRPAGPCCWFRVDRTMHHSPVWKSHTSPSFYFSGIIASFSCLNSTFLQRHPESRSSCDPVTHRWTGTHVKPAAIFPSPSAKPRWNCWFNDRSLLEKSITCWKCGFGERRWKWAGINSFVFFHSAHRRSCSDSNENKSRPWEFMFIYGATSVLYKSPAWIWFTARFIQLDFPEEALDWVAWWFWVSRGEKVKRHEVFKEVSVQHGAARGDQRNSNETLCRWCYIYLFVHRGSNWILEKLFPKSKSFSSRQQIL